MNDLKAKLNPSQLEAVQAIYGPVLVIAGAGSGKTRVIEYRVLNMVQNNIDPASILLLTFTREASRKMLARATAHDSRCKSVDGGTFHSFAYKLLKRYAKVIGFPESFSIMDEADSLDAVQRCVAALNLFDGEKKFPKKDTLKSIISGVINKNTTVGKILEKEYPDFFSFKDDIENLGKKYAEYKIERNLLDYDDLLIYAKLLLENEIVRKKISERYKFIMVDEYQDTNKLQADIARSLSYSHNNIMVVGDDAQSIYGFRGAFHENIMKFPENFDKCKIIKLEENYRSTQSILDLANSVLENMQNKYSKCLVSARQDLGEKPQIQFFSDAYREAEWLAAKIKELCDEGLDLADQAVLFRSSYISIPLQAELSKKGIPYQVFGGLKFYETAHVKDLMSHLKVISNPKDELGWARVLMLLEGIGPKTSDKILKDIASYSTLAEILEKSFEGHNIKFKYSPNIRKLQQLLKYVLEETDIGNQFSKVLDYYLPILKNKFDDWNLRLNDLETLKQISCRYDSLEDLLADFAIESPDSGVKNAEYTPREEEKPLTLSTIHSAKGLEWTNVYLLGLMDGVFPVSFSLGDEDEIEEEHRLFYVAVTRAKNNLILSLHHEASRGGINQFNKISRFVDRANILSKLNKQAIIDPDIDDDDISSCDFDQDTVIYDKKSLYNKVTRIF